MSEAVSKPRDCVTRHGGGTVGGIQNRRQFLLDRDSWFRCGKCAQLSAGEKADVTFATNRTTLTPEAKVALDMIAAKVQSLPAQ